MCTKLTYVYICGARLSHFPDLQGCAQLREVDIEGNAISRINCAFIPSQVCILSLKSNRIEEIVNLKEISGLKKLNPSGN